jgi:hypothetical protein
VSKGTHDFDIHFEVIEGFKNASNNFSLGVANEYFNIQKAHQGWIKDNGGIGVYAGNNNSKIFVYFPSWTSF